MKHNICTVLDEDYRLKVIENSFFKLFCHNEFVKNVYNNNKESHFKIILQNKGFIIETLGHKKTIK